MKKNGIAHLGDEAELDTKTMRGDLRDMILQVLRQAKKPWEKMSELEQRQVIGDVTFAANSMVSRMAHLVAAAGQPTLCASFKGLTFKDSICEVKMALSRFDEARHELVDAAGSTVLIVLPGVERFTGERKPAPVDRDQKPLFDETAAGRA